MYNVIEIADDFKTNSGSKKTVHDYTARRIVFCIDVSDDMNQVLRGTPSGGVKSTNLYPSSRLETVKRFLKRYVATNKMIGNDNDEYAIVLLTDVAIWHLDFTASAFIVNTEIDALSEDRLRAYADFASNVDYYYQAIVIYGRSSVPTLPTNDVMKNMKQRNNFILDVIVLHDGFKNTNAPDIYGKWDDLDKLNPERPGWVYEGSLFNGKDIIAEALSQLIGHPAYRGTQIGAGEDI
ncbi:BRISC and BRCA1-A complex member 1-like protein [Mucor lusitanicus]